MEKCSNRTETIFHILAFSTSETGQCLLLTAILLMYLMTVLGNITIATLVCLVSQLHTPMYFFLSNLAVVDVMYVSVTLPKLISILLTQDNRMSFSACMTQVYFFSLSAAGDIYVLTSMSYDRYVAICKPLQYPLFMSKDVCVSLALGSWLLSGINAIINVLITSLLAFCSTQNVNHFFCEQRTLYAVTSSDTSSRDILLVFQNMYVVALPFLFIITSYVFIISAILSIQSSEGRRKAFSSCTSHLTTVILFFGPIIILYTKPESEHSKEMDNLFSILYTAVVPMLNPFVYTLRNKVILKAMTNLARSTISFFME
ncbi:olfactory receptor 5V1-like [Aquarana catesbeiana]|uniref:olfactory receptor 5V1-like n=1 Tax=Aquarana catesbeiana TaxID=8400 RepID=UPI003CC935DD